MGTSMSSKTMSWYNTSSTDFYQFEFKDNEELSMFSMIRSFIHQFAKKKKKQQSTELKKGIAVLQKRGIDGLKCSNINMSAITNVEVLEEMKLTFLECVNCNVADSSFFSKIPSTLTTLKISGVDNWLDQRQAAFWRMIEEMKNLKTLELTDFYAYKFSPNPQFDPEQLKRIFNKLDRIKLAERLISHLWKYPDLLKRALSSKSYNTTEWCPQITRNHFTPKDIDQFMSLLIADGEVNLWLDQTFDLEIYKRLTESKDGWPEIRIRNMGLSVPLLQNVSRLHFWDCSSELCKWLCDSIRLNDPKLTVITTGIGALSAKQYEEIQLAMKENTHLDVDKCNFEVKSANVDAEDDDQSGMKKEQQEKVRSSSGGTKRKSEDEKEEEYDKTEQQKPIQKKNKTSGLD